MADINYPIANKQELDNLKQDYANQVEFPITNLVTNGDFSNGTTGYTIIGASSQSINNGKLKVNFNGSSYTPQVQSHLNLIEGRKYYISLEYNSNDLTNSKMVRFEPSPFLTVYDSVSNPAKFSIVITGVSGKNTLILMNNGYTNHLPLSTEWLECGNIIMVDLTEAFGAGNEPTKEEMDELMTYFPNGWFDGAVNLANHKWFMTYMLKKFREKANKVQGKWITPTLLNGWVGLFQVRYRKDEFGVVRLKGRIEGGVNGTTVFTLPVGYVPIETGGYLGMTTSGTHGRVNIYASGVVEVSTFSSYLYLDGITFPTI